MNESEKLNSNLSDYIGNTLVPLGWIESCRIELPVDARKQPLPWWTYPAIEFIITLVKPGFRVFEYGGGHSTLWWSRRVSKVVAVDHDKEWVDKICPNLRYPHELLFFESGRSHSKEAQGVADVFFQSRVRTEFPYTEERITRRGLNDVDFIAYADIINNYDEKFDCIVIDGMARRLCSRFAVPKLSDGGVIIFDNSNRSDYIEGYQYLLDAGFYQLRFWGNVAGASFPSCTSIFIRSLDSLPKVAYQPSIFNLPEY